MNLAIQGIEHGYDSCVLYRFSNTGETTSLPFTSIRNQHDGLETALDNSSPLSVLQSKVRPFARGMSGQILRIKLYLLSVLPRASPLERGAAPPVQ